jgi:hypothetical protein
MIILASASMKASPPASCGMGPRQREADAVWPRPERANRSAHRFAPAARPGSKLQSLNKCVGLIARASHVRGCGAPRESLPSRTSAWRASI